MKQFSKYLFIILLLSSGHMFAQSNTPSTIGTIDTIQRNLSSFNEIKIGGRFDVHIIQGSNESIKLLAPHEIKDRIVAEVDGGVLRIRSKHDNWGWSEKSWWNDKGWWQKHHDKIVVYVAVKDIKSITVSGSGSATFQEGITATSLDLKTRGSGSITGKIDVKKLESSISGSGNINICGVAENSVVKVSGSGNFKARELVTINSAAHISGSGNAVVNASDKVNAAISGSGGLSYTGSATLTTNRKSGSGSISKI